MLYLKIKIENFILIESSAKIMKNLEILGKISYHFELVLFAHFMVEDDRNALFGANFCDFSQTLDVFAYQWPQTHRFLIIQKLFPQHQHLSSDPSLPWPPSASRLQTTALSLLRCAVHISNQICCLSRHEFQPLPRARPLPPLHHELPSFEKRVLPFRNMCCPLPDFNCSHHPYALPTFLTWPADLPYVLPTFPPWVAQFPYLCYSASIFQRQDFVTYIAHLLSLQKSPHPPFYVLVKPILIFPSCNKAFSHHLKLQCCLFSPSQVAMKALPFFSSFYAALPHSQLSLPFEFYIFLTCNAYNLNKSPSSSYCHLQSNVLHSPVPYARHIRQLILDACVFCTLSLSHANTIIEAVYLTSLKGYKYEKNEASTKERQPPPFLQLVLVLSGLKKSLISFCFLWVFAAVKRSSVLEHIIHL